MCADRAPVGVALETMEVLMLRSLREAWRALRGRRRLDVLDVIAEAEPVAASPSGRTDR
jgi:hypothetical protein